MFKHLKKLDVRGNTTWVDMPELGPKARIELKPAQESNSIYFNNFLRRAANRARRTARTDRVTTEDAAANREDDRDLYPKYVINSWENLPDENGNMVPFSVDHAKQLVAFLPDWLFDRLRNVASTPERFLGENDTPDVDPQELAGN